MGKNIGLLAIDQGTTSSRALAFDPGGQVLAVDQMEFPQHYPADGHVEHDAEDIWRTTLKTAQNVIKDVEAGGVTIAAIGITNQRETTVIWERSSGKPIHKAIVWQDRRTAQHCRDLKADGAEDLVRERAGLLLDPYFSATKIAWILDHVPGAREAAERGDLAFGTIECFLLWRLTGGREHKTDVTNAARTSLMDLHQLCWDDDLLRLFGIPKALLPEICANTADFGTTDKALFGRTIPIKGMAGDQQSASIGQCCFAPGTIKSTYGTGCFVLMNTGDRPLVSQNRLLSTVAYKTDEDLAYALEGSIFIAGAAVQWLRDGLGVIATAQETQKLAESLDDNGGVYLVPAFTGLGAPHWDADARGGLFGLTRGTGPAHLARAALESVCYQTVDLLHAMAADGHDLKSIKVDGGMVANDWLMQFLADVLDMEVTRPKVQETTALGAAYLAGLQAGVYGSFADIEKNWELDATFTPKMTAISRKTLLAGWTDAVSRVKTV